MCILSDKVELHKSFGDLLLLLTQPTITFARPQGRGLQSGISAWRARQLVQGKLSMKRLRGALPSARNVNFVGSLTFPRQRIVKVKWVLQIGIIWITFIFCPGKREYTHILLYTRAGSRYDSWLLFFSTHLTSKTRPPWWVHAKNRQNYMLRAGDMAMARSHGLVATVAT